MTARGDKFGPDALSCSEDGRHIAFVGPSEFAVTVVNGKNLDEVISSLPEQFIPSVAHAHE